MLGNLKLRQKFVILLFITSVIPLIAISIANYYYAKSQLEHKTIESLRAVNNSRAAHINHSIQLRQEQSKAMAGAYLIRQLRESGLNDPEIIQGIQADIDSTYSDLHQTPSSQYKDIDKKTDIDIIEAWDVLGNVIAASQKNLIGRKMPIEYMQSVYKQGTYFRGFEKDPLTGNNYLVHLEEIRNWKSNEIVGAVALKIGAKILDDITTAREGLGQSGETYVVDKNYLMITQSRFVRDSILKTRVLTDGVQACFEHKPSPLIYRNYRGVDVLGVQTYLPDEEWCLVAEVDANEALAPVKALRNNTLVIGGLLTLIVLFFAYFVSQFFMYPILRLHNASKEVAAGNYALEVPVDSEDEIGGLTQAFNEMIKSLANARQELEEKSRALFKHLAISTRQRKELKEVNEELDSFVYTASHDLRAPLRGIASFASFLEEDYKDKLDATGRDYINEIRKGAGKMNEFIEDLLTLSRISRIKNPYADVNMNGLLESVLERLKYDIQSNKVELKVPKDLPVVHCDRIKMAEVFYNLINNAIKFSSKNNPQNPKIEVGYTQDADNHQFFVKDNGIGIDPKYHQQIFGLFKRLHTDKEYEGTGAGLSIIKRVIDGHQGRIWIDSQVGKGATFFFTIPKNLKSDKSGEEAEGPAGEQPPAG